MYLSYLTNRVISKKVGSHLETYLILVPLYELLRIIATRPYGEFLHEETFGPLPKRPKPARYLDVHIDFLEASLIVLRWSQFATVEGGAIDDPLKEIECYGSSVRSEPNLP